MVSGIRFVCIAEWIASFIPFGELARFSRAVLSGGSQTLEAPAVINLGSPLVQLLRTAHSLPYLLPASQLWGVLSSNNASSSHLGLVCVWPGTDRASTAGMILSALPPRSEN